MQVSKPVSVKPAGSAYTIRAESARHKVAEAHTQPSARCRRLLGQAGINATILRSPSITSEVDDEKSVDVGIGYDLLDLKRASLTEELAVAQCGRQAAIQRLSYLLVTGASAISHAGRLAQRHHNRGQPG